METEHNRIRVTMSISGSTNDLLEELQHHLRKTGSRHYKSRIVHEALEYFAEGLGLELDEATVGVDVEQTVEVEGEQGLGS